MNAAFLNQWLLYRRGAARAGVVGLEPRTDGAFDAPVAVGEVRVFADTNRPLVALVVEDRRLSGWRIVPVSPFCAPASARETLVGERVFQLWNATVVSRRFAARSWRVDVLTAGETAAVAGAVAAAAPGRLTAGDGAQARYEREFLVGEGTLVPFAAPRAAASAHGAWLPAAARIAASLVLCLAAWYLLLSGSGRRIVRDWRDGFPAVDIAREDCTIELVDARDAPEERDEIAEVDIDFTPPSPSWEGRSGAPQVARVRRLADVRGPKMPDTISKISPKTPPRYKSPVAAPLDVVFLTPAGDASPRVVAPPAGGTYAASAVRALAHAPTLVCTLSAKGLGAPHAPAVLQIAGEATPGAKITVMFDPEVVEGYRRSVTSAGGRITIVYELIAFAGREIAPGDVSATLVWPSKDGDANTPLAVGP